MSLPGSRIDSGFGVSSLGFRALFVCGFLVWWFLVFLFFWGVEFRVLTNGYAGLNTCRNQRASPSKRLCRVLT